MELIEHHRGVQRLVSEPQDHCAGSEEDNTRVNRIRSISQSKDREDDREAMSDCESESSEVLSVGSEPTHATDGVSAVDDEDDRRTSVDRYENEPEMNIVMRGVDVGREQDPATASGRSTLIRSSPSSRSPSPSPSSSASCNPPQSPASNYCTTPPQNQASPSSPSSVRSPASSSATTSSPGRPDAHQEAIVPRYQSASISTSSIHHHALGGPIAQNHHNHHHHPHHQHLLSSNRYAAASLVTAGRESASDNIVEYPTVISGGSTISRIPGIPGHHPLGLTNAISQSASAVSDLIGYSQQSIESGGRSLNSRAGPSLNVPLVTRLSLSPPTAMTVTGLQANAPSTAFHPVAVAVAAAAAAAAAAGCRDPRESSALLTSGHPAAHLQHPGITGVVQHPLLQSSSASQIQHVPASPTLLQHHQHHHHHQSSHNSRQNSIVHQSTAQLRLGVSKLVQQNSQDSSSTRETESPLSPSSRVDDHHSSHRQSHRHHETSRNSLQNTSPVPTVNNNHHRSNNNNNNSSSNNNNNNMQHQASLKFSIDNILKADFGRRITDPISLKKSRSKKVARPIDLTKDFLESSSEGSERGSETSAPNPSPGGHTVNPSATGASNNNSASTTGNSTTSGNSETSKQMLWPAWVYCTRYSDRPSSGRSPRTRRVKRPSDSRSSSGGGGGNATPEEKRPRTAFSGEQLARLKREFAENRYLTERRRQQLSRDLGLNEAQIKIWFQNKRAKIKKASGQKNPLALQLMAQGLYNHSTVPLTKEEEEQAAELQAK